jgi:hypothetical protein
LPLDFVYNKLLVYLSKYNKEFYGKILEFGEEYNLKVLDELRTRIRYFSEFEEFSSFFYFEPKLPNEKLLVNEKMKIISLEDAKEALKLALDILNKIPLSLTLPPSQGEGKSQLEEIKNIFVEEVAKAGMKNGQVLWPVRCALSGEEFSPGALELIYIL